MSNYQTSPQKKYPFNSFDFVFNGSDKDNYVDLGKNRGTGKCCILEQYNQATKYINYQKSKPTRVYIGNDKAFTIKMHHIMTGISYYLPLSFSLLLSVNSFFFCKNSDSRIRPSSLSFSSLSN
jgi:hypothetical protein